MKNFYKKMTQSFDLVLFSKVYYRCGLRKEDFMKYYSRSALSIYRYLETMSKSLDKVVLDIGKGSGKVSCKNYQTTHLQTSKMIKLMDRKRKLVNLKVVVEECLAGIPEDSRRILSLFYMDGITANLISQLLGVSLRTFFRQKTKALDSFCFELDKRGYGKAFFEEEYSCEKWFSSVYADMLTKNLEEDDCPNGIIIRAMLGDIIKIRPFSNTYV